MSPVEWYYARDNKQMGPVSSIELKRLATAGELGPDDLVWREGMTEWASARNVRGLFDEEGRGVAAASVSPSTAANPETPVNVAPSAAAPKRPPAPPSRHLFDALLDNCRSHFNAHFVETVSRVFRACGAYGSVVAAVVLIALSVIIAAKAGPTEQMLVGVAWALVLLALQYVAGKACDAIEEINANVGCRLSSAIIPNCLGVFCFAAGIAVLIGSVARAIGDSQYQVILCGIAGFFALAYLAVVAINPAALKVTIAPEVLPGEEAIGVVLFLVKALLRLAPAAYGVGIVYGTTLALWASGLVLAGGREGMDAVASAVAKVLLYAAAAPMAAYLLFLVAHLIVNIWRSLLSLPTKLDSLAEHSDREEKTP